MAKKPNTITLTLPEAQIEVLRGILAAAEGDAPAVEASGDRPRDAKGRFLPAGTTVKSPKGKAGKAARKAKKSAKSEKFVTWLHDTAEQRHARQKSNKEQAKWLRSKGIVPNGSAWEAAKHGERSVAALRACNKKDGLSVPAKKGSKKAAKKA